MERFHKLVIHYMLDSVHRTHNIVYVMNLGLLNSERFPVT
jgi:hypothetical protein